MNKNICNKCGQMFCYVVHRDNKVFLSFHCLSHYIGIMFREKDKILAKYKLENFNWKLIFQEENEIFNKKEIEDEFKKLNRKNIYCGWQGCLYEMEHIMEEWNLYLNE